MKPLDDYSFIRGVCHNPTLGLTPEELKERLEREFGFCTKLNINSIRFWMEPEEYDKDPEGYMAVVETFIRMAGERDITVMPIFWNGNFITDFKEPSEEWYEKARLYAEDVIRRLRVSPISSCGMSLMSPCATIISTTAPKRSMKSASIK